MSHQVATIRDLVRATGWRPSTRYPLPTSSNFSDAVDLADKKGWVVHRDGRCYVPYQRFVKRSLRKNPKAPG